MKKIAPTATEPEVNAEDAPDAWDEEGDEEAPEAKKDNGVDSLTSKLDDLKVGSK